VWSLFLIVYLHLQWNAVRTQIMLCLAEAVLRNSRLFHTNTYVAQKLKKNAQYIVHLGSYIFLFRGQKKGGGQALNIFSIFYTHHRIPNKHMMTINKR
jgi:hypothetical protein